MNGSRIDTYLQKRIPKAVFFDIDKISDQSSGLPHMLPSVEFFGRCAAELGLGAPSPDTAIVVYDSNGIFSSPRVWWTLKAFGYENVAVLDGGLPAWEAMGGELETGEPGPVKKVEPWTPALNRFMVANLEEVQDTDWAASDVALVDARSEGRFRAEAPEPRKGCRGGHIKHSFNIPFGEVLCQGKLKNSEDLVEVFKSRGVPLKGSETPKQITTSCGSGVTAAMLYWAATAAGYEGKLTLYDGSWAEWGGRSDTEVVVGED